MKKWWVIYIGLLLSVMTLASGIYSSGGFPSEEYISAAAFIMLISTAILQNTSLQKQHEEVTLNRKSLDKQIESLEKQIEEVKLNRQSLDIQSEEMKNHTKAFQESNTKTEISLKTQQFYEILNLKEHLYLDVIKEVSDKDGLNDVERYNELTIGALKDFVLFWIEMSYKKYFFEANIDEMQGLSESSLWRLYDFLDSEQKQGLREMVREHISEFTIDIFNYGGFKQSMLKLYSYHVLIQRFTFEDTGIEGSLHKFRDEILEEDEVLDDEILYGKVMDLSLDGIYQSMLSDDEKLLYKIMSGKLEFEDVFTRK